MAMTLLREQTAPQAVGELLGRSLSRPLVAWHLLSLDAPTVAAAWMYLFARCWHVQLAWSGPAALFLTVWLLYAADRLLDAATSAGRLEARHRFHHRHQRAFLLVMPAAAAGLIPLLALLPRAQLRLDAELGALLLLWLGLVHGCPRLRLPKELAVGVFFAMAVCVPELCAPAARGWRLLVAAAAFGLLCTLNCLWIALWEGDTAAPHRVSRGSVQAATALLTLLPLPLHAPLAWALALSALALLGLDALQRPRQPGMDRLPRTSLRAAADFALLTPLLVLPFLQ